MIALIVTLATFTLVGSAASALLRLVVPGTIAGRVAWWYLAGVATLGTTLHLLGVLRVPLMRITLAAVLLAAVVALIFNRNVKSFAVRHGAVPTILLALPLAALVFMAAVLPIRDYDGRVTWLPKARAIAHDGAIDGRFFQGQAGLNLHNHYPLLMPLNAASILILTGSDAVESTRWLYVFVAIAAFVAARDLIAISQPRSAAWVVAAAAWLPMLLSIEGGALAAYNDVTILALTGMAALSLHTAAFGHAGVRAAALFLTALVLTKNEGIVIAVAVVASAVVVRRVRSTRDWLTLAASIAGAVILLAIWRRGGPAAYDEQYGVLVQDLWSSFHRLPDALEALVKQSIDPRTWGWFWPATAVSAAIALAGKRRIDALAPLVLMLLVLGVYAVTFTVTSWNIDELATVAASRLLLHLVLPACWLIAIAAETLGARSAGVRESSPDAAPRAPERVDHRDSEPRADLLPPDHRLADRLPRQGLRQHDLAD